MAHRFIVVALILGAVSLPLSCGGDDDSSSPSTGNKSGKGGGAGKAGTGGKSGSAGTATSGGRGGSGTGGSTGGSGIGGSGAGRGGTNGGAGSGGTGGDIAGTGGIGNTGNMTGDAGMGGDPGVEERLPLCTTVCGFAPESGAAGAAGAAGAGGAGGSEAGTGPTGGSSCGHEDACIASLCPEQVSLHCGNLLTKYIQCLCDTGPSLVTECTPSAGPRLDPLIFECYASYANWTRGCL